VKLELFVSPQNTSYLIKLINIIEYTKTHNINRNTRINYSAII